MKSDYLAFAETIARQAGMLLKSKLTNKHTITFKGDINIVTEADEMSEKLLLDNIRTKFPEHDILTEESIGIEQGSEFRWIIDPLDGTTNYAHGYPVFCVSLALEVASEIRYGIVYNPMMEEMFAVVKGGGAFLNGVPLTVSDTENLSQSLVATGFPYDIRESENNNIDHFISMATKVQAIRRAGSAALDLAYVAAGRFDGFWELKLMPWDTAAGLLLVAESGGTVSDIEGRAYHLMSPSILASNGKIHSEMTNVLAMRGDKG